MFSRVQCDNNASFEGQNSYRHRHYLPPFDALFAKPVEGLSTQPRALPTPSLPPAIVSLGDLILFPHEMIGQDGREAGMGSEKMRGKVDEEGQMNEKDGEDGGNEHQDPLRL
jgi:hypothetical protein